MRRSKSRHGRLRKSGSKIAGWPGIASNSCGFAALYVRVYPEGHGFASLTYYLFTRKYSLKNYSEVFANLSIVSAAYDVEIDEKFSNWQLPLLPVNSSMLSMVLEL